MNDLNSLLALRKKPDGAIWKFFGHVFLVALTFGIWFWVWLYFMWAKSKHNEEIFRQLELMAAKQDGARSVKVESSFPTIG